MISPYFVPWKNLENRCKHAWKSNCDFVLIQQSHFWQVDGANNPGFFWGHIKIRTSFLIKLFNLI